MRLKINLSSVIKSKTQPDYSNKQNFKKFKKFFFLQFYNNLKVFKFKRKILKSVKKVSKKFQKKLFKKFHKSF